MALAVVELTIFVPLRVDGRLAREIVGISAIFPMIATLGFDMFCILDYVKKIRGYHHFTYRHFIKRAVKIVLALNFLGQMIFLPSLMLRGKDPLYPIVVISLFFFFLLNLVVLMRRYISWDRFVGRGGITLFLITLTCIERCACVWLGEIGKVYCGRIYAGLRLASLMAQTERQKRCCVVDLFSVLLIWFC